MGDVSQLVADAAKDGGPAVLSSRLRLRPAGALPVVRAAVYSDGARTWGQTGGANPSPGPVLSTVVDREGREKRVAIIESVEARAHDLSLALRLALEEARAAVPTLKLYRRWDGQDGRDLIADSWTAPHRIADAYWREAHDPTPAEQMQKSWPRFFESPRGKTLDPAGEIDNLALLNVYPTSLLLGYDPRASELSARSGRQARKPGRGKVEREEEPEEESRLRRTRRPHGRLIRSEIVAEVGGLYFRTQSLLRPFPALSDKLIYVTKDGDWTLDEAEADRDDKGGARLYPAARGREGRPSAIGLDDVTPSLRGVPDIWATEITLSSYVSFAGIRAIGFPSLDSGRGLLARKVLVAMAVAAILGAERDLRIRSDCDLVLDDGGDAIRREIGFADKPAHEIEVTYKDAVDALRDVVAEAEQEGIWQPQNIDLVASKNLAGLLPPVAEGRWDAANVRS
jgi:hypothetical protein